LDAQSAYNLVRFLRKLAAAGQAILCTIHQPSALLFENFDRLLLLERGGETVYFGDIGSDSRILREYLARNGADCPDDANPAEFMLEAIGAGSSRRIGPHDWKDIWLASPEYQKVLQEIEKLDEKGRSRVEETAVEPQTCAYLSRVFSTFSHLCNHIFCLDATPLFYQLKVVTQRAMAALWRSPDYVWTRMFVHVFISLFVSLTFLQLGDSVRDLQFRVFA
jgi:ATP-binding cassette, subfamily G (WHITE), member 2, SNQ2